MANDDEKNKKAYRKILEMYSEGKSEARIIYKLNMEFGKGQKFVKDYLNNLQIVQNENKENETTRE